MGNLLFMLVESAAGSVAVVYDESSTEYNPVMLVTGVNSKGEKYEEKIEPLKVNPNKASGVEMAGLTTYLMDKGEIKTTRLSFTHNIGMGLDGGHDVFDKQNFISSLTFKIQLIMENQAFVVK